MPHGVSHEVGQLGQGLDACVAGADEDECQLGFGAVSVPLHDGRLEPSQDVVAEMDRVRKILEAEAVLGQAGNRQAARDRAEGQDGLLVVDLEGAGLSLDRGRVASRIERRQPTEEELCMWAHQAERHDDVTRFERARGCLGQERREEHEVLEAHDRRATLAEEPCDVRAGEAAAEDEGAASGVPAL